MLERWRACGRGWRGGVLALGVALAPVPALAQAGSKAPPPPPAPTVFARKPEPRRTLALSSRAEWIAPVVRRLAVRPMARSVAPARRLTVVNLKGSARPARPTSPPALAAAPVTAAKVDQGAAPASVPARPASSTPNAALAAAPVAAPTTPPAAAPNAAPTTPPTAAPKASTAAVTPPRAAPATASSTNTSAPARPAASAVPRATASAPPRTVAASTPTSSAAQERAGWANVTYISGPSVYLDAGTRAGLKEGSRLEVFRGNRVIAELLVAYVSSTRSSCSVTTSTLPIEVGDSARFTPVRAVMAQVERAMPTTDSARARTASRPASRPIRGRFGVRYLVMQQDGGGVSSTLTQPAFDIRLDGHHINGTPFGLMVDVRAYRQNYSRTSGTSLSNSTRAYQTALLWNPVNSGTRMALGRQFSGALSPVGLFDGLSIDHDRRHFSVGGFSGSQPDPRSFGYSGDVREHGAYVQWHNAPNVSNATAATGTWAMTAGGIGSYSGGKIDREFGYLQGTFNNRYFSLYTAQEIDVNRGWKSDVESAGATPTSTFAMVRISPNDAFTLFGGYDNRRSVRLYRDFLNPEIAFDDTFRQGTWGGASLYVLGHLRLNADMRTSRGGTAGTADSYTGSVHVTRISPLQLGAQLRTTRYTGVFSSGDLSAASIEMRPIGSLRVEVNGGRRTDTRANTELSNSSTTWWGADADVGIGRSLYLMASTYRETGGFQRNMQTMLALTYRF